MRDFSDEELLRPTPKRPAAFDVFFAWLLAIARHKLLRSIERGRVEDRARRRLGAPRLEFDDEELERVDALVSTPVHELLAALPASEAEAVRARVLDEEPYDVIAARMRCSELVAGKRVSRGLARFTCR